MGTTSIHVNSGDLGWSLLNIAPEQLERTIEVHPAERRPGTGCQHVPFEIVAACGSPQLNDACVGLVSWKVWQQPGGGAQRDGQDACHRRVQGSAVTNPFQAEAAAETADAGMRGEARRLVDHHKAARTVHCPPPC